MNRFLTGNEPYFHNNNIVSVVVEAKFLVYSYLTGGSDESESEKVVSKSRGYAYRAAVIQDNVGLCDTPVDIDLLDKLSQPRSQPARDRQENE